MNRFVEAEPLATAANTIPSTIRRRQIWPAAAGNSRPGFSASISRADQHISACPAGIRFERVSVGLLMRWIVRIHCIAAVIWAASRGMATAMVEVGEEG